MTLDAGTLTRDQAAAYLQVSARWLASWRHNGAPRPLAHPARPALYLRAYLDTWVQEQQWASTAAGKSGGSSSRPPARRTASVLASASPEAREAVRRLERSVASSALESSRALADLPAAREARR